ncbi:MAG: ATP-dependent RecD-like DNA helicase [Myxococcota bacterium]
MYADSLEGELVGFTFKAGDGGFGVGRVRLADGVEAIAVGAIGHLHEGQRIAAQGQWVVDTRFGRQFRIERLLVEDPRTLKGMERYLASAIDGVGAELARRIVDKFGLDTLKVLGDAPHRLDEVDGIGAKTRDRIVAAWQSDASGRELMVTLRGFDLSPSTCRRIAERFGKDAPAVVTRQPYRLVEVRGVGFRTADAIARQQGIARDDPARVEAAIQFVLEEAEDEGSCFLPETVLLERLVALDVALDVARERLDGMAAMGRVARHRAATEGDRPVYRVPMEKLEARVARALRERLAGVPPALAVDVPRAEAAVGLELSPGQREAVALALRSGVSVVTGGPGTGKTTIVRVLLAAGVARGEAWLCCAPTGRAARRLAETTKQEAKTIHRLLEFSMQQMDFTRNSEKPLEADGVLVDEASMVDLRLFAALLDALPPRCRLVLVGDADQLPSVGAGDVLRDVIASEVVPVARLAEVYRQAADSGIVRNAWRVNRGEVPISAEKEGGARDFFVVTREDATDARETVLQVVRERLPRLGFDPRRDVQVLTPMHAGPLGTVALNAALGAALNPDGAPLRWGERTFRVGDRVIQTRNDYDADVFNGDVGRVVSVEHGLTVDFDGREVTLAGDALDALDPAWAISIHKSQGSEYPAVVVAVHTSHFVLLRRNLLYTALTRAKRFACVVGSARALRTAVGRTGGDARWTGLAGRLR